MKLRPLYVFVALLAGCATSNINGQTPVGGVPDCKTCATLNGLEVYVGKSSGPEVFTFGHASVSTSRISAEAFWDIPKEGSRLATKSSVQGPPGSQKSLLGSDEEYALPITGNERARRWAAGIVPRHSHTFAKAIAVLDLHNDRRIEGTAGFSIAALAFSQDASLLAVLEDTYETRVRSFRDFVSPHPVPYSDILLTVYEAGAGRVVCQSILLRDARYAVSKIVWR